ncbi:MAG: cytochrome c-type biogenesis protein [Pseudohongiellaceae bacterium]
MALITRYCLRCILLFSLGAFSVFAVAAVDTFEFDTDEQQQRFRNLSDELRCPMCQYANLSSSTGGVAEDLRREIYLMIMEGRTDEEIEQFMFERYGEFIFFRPRFNPSTYLLWFGPLIFLLIGALVAWAILRKSRGTTVASSGLSAEEQEKLARLLKQK